MTNPRQNSRPKSIVLNNGPQSRVYRTFEEWEAERQNDTRTPEERGIKVGSAVMWRHRNNGIILTERATVEAITDNTLTLQVKDVQTRTCSVNIQEIVDSTDDRLAARDANRRAFSGNRSGNAA
jgi:hypothetical protein